jgi:hypothetical protein
MIFAGDHSSFDGDLCNLSAGIDLAAAIKLSVASLYFFQQLC